MKLNHDCIRNLLITIESEVNLTDELFYPMIRLKNIHELKAMSSFDLKDIAYSAQILKDADYIDAKILTHSNGISDVIFFGLTYGGHKYLDSIRNDKIWFKVKGKLMQSGGSLTFSLIQKLAESILLSQLGLNR